MPVRPGQYLHQRLQETDATYRVVAVADGLVTLEVVVAPGLSRGYRMRVLQEAAAAMTVVDEPPPPPSTRFRRRAEPEE